jgi:hypothetical protein
MKSSINRIHIRFFIGVASIAIFLFFGFIVQTIKKQYEIDSNGLFVPLAIIEQTKVVYQALSDNATADSFVFPCGGTTERILSEKISNSENKTLDASKIKLEYLWHKYSESTNNPSCKYFPEIIIGAYLLKNSIKSNPKIPLITQARQLYSQNLIWKGQIFCIYGKDYLGKFLVYGRAANCDVNGVTPISNNLARINIKDFLRPIIALAKNRTSDLNDPKVSNQFITLDPQLQLLVQQLERCNAMGNDCPNDLKKILKDTEYATFTIMDAVSRDILATGCYGDLCNDERKFNSHALAGMGIESPPASTEKLLFAYALAKSGRTPQKMLTLQIKTSVELDDQVSKRNEWWERQAICDPKKSGINCPIAKDVIDYSRIIGWNQECSSKASILCGTSSLLNPLGLEKFSPTSGRALISVDAKGYYFNEKLLKHSPIPWNEYESIRSGKTSPRDFKGLESTSMLIQSVIGAGDNRVTSLGLAMLSSGIYQSALLGKVSNTRLFKVENELPSYIPASSPAAQTILQGMQKVLTAAEPGWVGEGTGYGAFKFAFGKSCEPNCPIYGKTGTVSSKDKSHAGSTLFTAIVKERELRLQFSNINSTSNRTLAIGVISKPNRSGAGHQASKLGLLIAREIINQPEQVK